MQKRTVIGAGAAIVGFITLANMFNGKAPPPKAPPAPAPKAQPVPVAAPTPEIIMDARKLASGTYVINRSGAGLFERDRVNDKVGRRFANMAEGSCVEMRTVTNNQDVQFGHALVDAVVDGMPGLKTGYVQISALTFAPEKTNCTAKFLSYTP